MNPYTYLPKGLFNNVLTNLRSSTAGQSTGSLEYEFAAK